MTSIAESVETPAFVVDERIIADRLEDASRLREASGCRLLYALKPLSCEFALRLMRGRVDGFAASSLFEARLARAVLGGEGSVHLTTPGLRAVELPELSGLCDQIAFNSLTQYERLAGSVEGPCEVGLRVNPRESLVPDERYDPCRPHSKLGVPIERLQTTFRRTPERLEAVRGLQFHTSCDGESFEPLLRTVRLIEERLGPYLARLDWINLGGGYLFDREADFGPLVEAVDLLRARYGLEVYFEPGAALVREAGSLVAEVIDLFTSDGRAVAVLDTTVNHAPEVFEFQFEPDVLGHDDDGDYDYLLAGSTCLAGDVLGEYAFHEPLRIGSRVVIQNLGAYALVKAHMFNGVNLPTLYSVTEDGELVLRRRFTYDDFLSRCGTPDDAIV